MLYPDLHYGLTNVRCIYDKRAHYKSMPCCLYVKSSCCIFLFEENTKTCPNFLLIFSQKVVIRFCLFFSSCAHPCYILCVLLLKYTHVTETPILHRYRHIGMPYIQAKYVTFACCGFSFKVHPLSMHPSAYKLLPSPLQTKAKNRLQLVTKPPAIGISLTAF